MKADWSPSSSTIAQLRAGSHTVPTSAIPRVSQVETPHRSCGGGAQKTLGADTQISEDPAWSGPGWSPHGRMTGGRYMLHDFRAALSIRFVYGQCVFVLWFFGCGAAWEPYLTGEENGCVKVVRI